VSVTTKPVFALAAFAALGALAFDAAASSPNQHLVALEQVSPLPYRGTDSPPIEFRAGWPLIYRLSIDARDMLGIGRLYGNQVGEEHGWEFPEVGQGGAIVFSNPDGEWSYSHTTFDVPHDESFIDFYPDPGDRSGVNDDAPDAPGSHDTAVKLALRPEFGGPLPRYDGTRHGDFVVLDSLPDGVQFGADDDMPGLVILSNIGVGVVMSDFADGWLPVSPRQARNLAGFTNSVGYELNDRSGRTSITATMIVPRFLFSHIRVLDPCIGAIDYDAENNPVACAGPNMQRVDGGPLEPEASNDEALVEIRAFVVAPHVDSVSGQLEYLQTVTDMNGDGQVTASDAAAMGWQVLSNEVISHIRQIGNNVSAGRGTYAYFNFCNGQSVPTGVVSGGVNGGPAAGADFIEDLDGNGYSVLVPGAVCPGGGSGVTQPPR
jgi:hypothetical protein